MHATDCSCTRCAGFEKGNDLAVRHGAKAVVKLGPRASEIEEGLRAVVPVRSAADDATIAVLSMVLAQLERASAVLGARQAEELRAVQAGKRVDPAGRDDLRRLAQDARGWSNSALRYFEALGLTPTARARLGLDLARTRTLTVADLHLLAGEDAA